MSDLFITTEVGWGGGEESGRWAAATAATKAAKQQPTRLCSSLKSRTLSDEDGDFQNVFVNHTLISEKYSKYMMTNHTRRRTNNQSVG